MDLPDRRFYAVMPTTTYIVGSFLLTHKMDLFNHDMICSLALINKEWESIVNRAAPELRNSLTSKLPLDIFDAGEGIIVWHKNGTAFGRKRVFTGDDKQIMLSDQRKRVTFNLDSIYWQHGDIEIYSSEPFYSTKKKTQDIVRPGFNNNGDFCCYSIGGNIALWNQVEHVVEYRLSKNKSLFCLYSPVQILRCGLRLKKNKSFPHYALSYFLSFPFLLQCFLNSKVVDELEGFSKLYSLEDAIIPHNYQECVPSPKYQSFDDLPEQLKEEIVEHYNQQQAQNNQSAPKKKKIIEKIIFWK